eukprot:gene8733-11818_t
MKFTTFLQDGQPRLGLVDGEQVIDLNAAQPQVPVTVAERAAAAQARPLTPEQQKVKEAEAQLAEMLTHYTPQHPDVIAAKRRLDVLKSSAATAVAALDVLSAAAGVAAAQDFQPKT